MSSETGNNIKITLFGQSHGQAVGAVAENIPGGIRIDGERLAAFMKRRAGGNSPYTTPRAEEDIPVFLSGVCDGVTTGQPMCVIFENKNRRSDDYKNFNDTPRPSHADYTSLIRYGADCDIRGGGHSSGRLTAGLCAVGFVCMQYLETRGIYIGSHLERVGDCVDLRFDPVNVSKKDFNAVLEKDFPVIEENCGIAMKKEIQDAMDNKDSVGAVVECAVVGLDAGYGSPIFDGIENLISKTVFGLGGVRGIEFGLGFEAAKMRGSAHNDSFCFDRNGSVATQTNNHGGVLGGISSGMPIIFRVAFKPTASISISQTTVSLSKKTTEQICIKGRHDPCIGIRALPCVEAAAAIAITDILQSK